jgi:hypothetical protein
MRKEEEMTDRSAGEEEEIEDAVVAVAEEIEDAVAVAEEIEEEEAAAAEAISRDRRRSNGPSKNLVKRLVVSNPRQENERKRCPWIQLRLRFNAAFIPSCKRLW